MPDPLPRGEGRGPRRRLAVLVVALLVGVAVGQAAWWSLPITRTGGGVEIETGAPPRPGVSSIPVASVVHVGDGADGVAVDPALHVLYTANTEDGTVSVVDTASRAVVATVAVGGSPQQLAVDPDSHAVYVGGTKDGAVSVIDAAARAVVATIPVDGSTAGLAVDPRTRIVYVATTDRSDLVPQDWSSEDSSDDETDYPAEEEYLPEDTAGSLTMIDTATRAFIGSIALPKGASPSRVALDPAANTAYVAGMDAAGPGSVAVVDTATRKVVGAFLKDASPEGLAVDTAAHTLYVTTSPEDDTASLVVRDARKGATVTIRLEDEALHEAVIDPRTGVVYALSGSTVTGIDPAGRKVVSTTMLGRWGKGLAIDPEAGVLYATDDAGSLYVVKIRR